MSESATGVSKPRHLWREYRGFLAFVFLMMAFRSAFADWVRVPTGSMNPTILEGDRVLVDKQRFTACGFPGRSRALRTVVILLAGRSWCSTHPPPALRW